MSLPSNNHDAIIATINTNIPDDILHYFIFPFTYHLEQIDTIMKNIQEDDKESIEKSVEYTAEMNWSSGLAYILKNYKVSSKCIYNSIKIARRHYSFYMEDYLKSVVQSNNHDAIIKTINTNIPDDLLYYIIFPFKDEFEQIDAVMKIIQEDDNESIEESLEYAAEMGWSSGLAYVLNNYEISSKCIYKSLKIAARYGSLDIVKHLNELLTDKDGWTRGYLHRNTALVLAASCGNLDIVKYLCELVNKDGFHICAPSAGNNEAIRNAAESGYLDVVKFLCELVDKDGNYICNPSAEDNDAICLAARYGHFDVVKYLCELVDDDGYYICDPSAQGDYAIINAAWNGHLDVVKYLCELVYDDGYYICSRNNALNSAAENGRWDVYDYLCDILGIDVEF